MAASAQESGWGHPCLERCQGPAATTLPPPHRHPSARQGLRREGGLSCQPQGAGSCSSHTGRSTADVLFLLGSFLGRVLCCERRCSRPVGGSSWSNRGGEGAAGLGEVGTGSGHTWIQAPARPTEGSTGEGPCDFPYGAQGQGCVPNTPGSLNTQPEWVPSLSSNLRPRDTGISGLEGIRETKKSNSHLPNQGLPLRAGSHQGWAALSPAEVQETWRHETCMTSYG